jgi:4-amino-4-deoxy-L-arabinose transferase-like glycosyltransferase
MIELYNAEWETWLQKWFIRLLIPAILVNAGGLLIAILEPDGALYATIAKTIARSGDFVNLWVDGKDWLDKPHFPFWMAALSFRFFGINAFAYKFPALLFWGAGAYYSWRLAFSLYGKPVAQLSTLIYVSAAHLVISNNDVRAEPYLVGLIIGAVYHFYKASRSPEASRPAWPWLHLLAGSLLAAAALMTKGPFVLITIAAGFVLDWVIGREWGQFHSMRWWIAIILTALFTLPEIICLYIQFDLHPDKQVFGHTGVSGIRFFFWDSQFGRFFNTGPIKGSGDPLFYFHTLLWAFLPWSLLLYAAVIQKCRNIRRAVAAGRQGSAPGQQGPATGIPGDWICLGAALASFVLFSLSRFQLPHYLNILFPFFSILTANYLYGVRRKGSQKAIRIAQGIINGILPALLLFLCWFFHFHNWPLLLVLLSLLSLLPFLLFRGAALPVSIIRSFWLALLVFAFVNFLLYPAILQYQAGTQAGRYADRLLPSPAAAPAAATATPAAVPAAATAAPTSTFYMLQEAPVNYSFEFYCRQPVQRISMDSLPLEPGGNFVYVFAPSKFGDSLQKRGYTVTTMHQFPNFHISQLTGAFLNYRTRDSVLEWYAILRVNR